MANWINKGRKGDAPKPLKTVEGTHWYFLRLCATFPAIAQLRELYRIMPGKERDQYGGHGWNFHAEEIASQKLYDESNWKDSLYWKHLKELTEHSDKIQKLKEQIDMVLSSKLDPPEKMLVLSYSPAVALILHMVCIFQILL
jgi:hypothetical protein